MGCGTSHAAPSEPVARVPPADKPLEDWDAHEVAGWFGTLVPDLLVYRRKILDEGCVVARWTEQRLLLYRDRAVAKASAAAASAATLSDGSIAGARQPTALRLPAEPQQAMGSELPGNAATVTASIHVKDTTTTTSSLSKHESLVALAVKGIRFARIAIEKLGPSLPFPGAEAANLLLSLLDMVDSAIANHSNLAELQKRALAFLDILAAYHKELEELRYKRVVDEYRELLEGIKAYARVYVGRNCLMRLLTVSSDKGLVVSMGLLSDKVRTTLAVDTNAQLRAVHAAVEESRQLLERASLYQDPAAAARSLVAELGGLDAVLGEEDKLRQVVQQLDVGDRVTIETVSLLLSSHLDKGPHHRILQPDLRLFWRQCYAGEAEVPWFEFWTAFPKGLSDIRANVAMVGELRRLLTDTGAQEAFKSIVERSNRETVSVWELKGAFNGDEGLLEQVSRMLMLLDVGAAVATVGGHGGGGSGAAPSANMTVMTALQAGVGIGPTGGEASASMAGARCQLPPLVANYMGRDKEGAEVLEHLRSKGSLVLLAPGGMGKSCLAADVGWQMVRGGWAPGGALWVDLRGASSAVEVEARFCAALELQQEKSGNSARILAAVKALLPQPSPAATAAAAHSAAAKEALQQQVPTPGALLVVDNAEDPLLAVPQNEMAAEATGGRALLSLLCKVCREAPAARLLVTSRTSLGLTSSNTATPSGRLISPIALLPEQHVGAIGLGPATQLVRAVAADLTEVDAASVAAACHCVPLVLDLVAQALVAGRLALQELPGLTMAEKVLDPTSHTVLLLLSGLHRSHQIAAVQLTVFPSAFDEEAAEAVLGVALPQAQATLALLYRHSVLLQGGAGAGGGGHRQFTMHMVVQQQAMQVGRQLDITVQLAAEGRFIASVLGLLSELATMYETAKQWQLALAMARGRQADISRMLELVGGSSYSSSGGALGSVDASHAPGAQGALGLAASASIGGRGMSAEHIAAALTAMVLNFLYDLGTMHGLEAARVRLLAQLGTGQESEVARGCLLYMGAWFYYMMGRYMEAEPLSRQALELRRRVLGEEHPDTANSIHNLAACIYAQGRYAEAEPLSRQALELRLLVLGEEHPNTASSINNLANCISDQGRYAEAELLYRQALELRQQVLGEEHPDTASSISNLASCIQDQGHYVEAEPLYRQALELRQRVLGEEHAFATNSINNLAGCIDAQGRYTEAEPLCRQALELRRQVLGEEHPDTANSINNLANCVSAQGRYGEAETLYRQALELRWRVLGEEHPATANFIGNLAFCIQAQGRYMEAEPLVLLQGGAGAGGGGHRQFTMHMVVQQQAMQVGRQLDITVQLAAEGRFIASVLGLLSELATMYETAKQWQLALAMARGRQADISRMLELVGGSSYSSSGGALGSVDASHAPGAQGALGLAASASIGGRGMSAEHIAAALTAMVLNFLYDLGTMHGLEAARVRLLAQLGTGQESEVARGCLLYMGAWFYYMMGRYMEAEPLSRQALKLQMRVLGEEHPDTANSINNLAKCIQAQGRYAEAELMYRQALELRQRVLGKEHPETANFIDDLAKCIQAQGRYVEAEPLSQQALELRVLGG
ncbi:Kinesin light chain [Tetrabaena socialis]|uniref:Kinesin light chain n=1 Tax=Tetrabaena socialis TaxID=47790 RepID=A0A2J7ZWW6_9CHLO|nr:Kinesin light chain [Tetrabaena socialis]|eukprot:PNH04770.1 Kinesin light chain [Tetrabaena socialis]